LTITSTNAFVPPSTTTNTHRRISTSSPLVSPPSHPNRQSPSYLPSSPTTTHHSMLPLSTLPPPLRAIGINALLFTLASPKLLQVLTKDGLISAFVLGSGLWMSIFGWKAWTLCVLYLGLGSMVTKIQFEKKETLGIAEGRGGRRGSENVWGSALTGLFCCIYATITSNPTLPPLLSLAYVSSIATKLSDTFASEIGKAYGKTTFLITTFQKVPAGTEGAISLEGTMAALVGAAMLPWYGWYIGLVPTIRGVGVATMSAFLATFAESWIGAEIQGRKGWEWMTNEVVNFWNTVIGAGLSILGSKLFL